MSLRAVVRRILPIRAFASPLLSRLGRRKNIREVLFGILLTSLGSEVSIEWQWQEMKHAKQNVVGRKQLL
jgi:hypothetical protein